MPKPFEDGLGQKTYGSLGQKHFYLPRVAPLEPRRLARCKSRRGCGPASRAGNSQEGNFCKGALRTETSERRGFSQRLSAAMLECGHNDIMPPLSWCHMKGCSSHTFLFTSFQKQKTKVLNDRYFGLYEGSEPTVITQQPKPTEKNTLASFRQSTIVNSQE